MEGIYGRIDESLRLQNKKIDVKDTQILCYLSENSRIPVTRLQKYVQLSKDSIAYRIEKLKRDNILIRFFPIIDLNRFGFYTFHTFFLLDETNKEKITIFIDFLKSLNYIKNIIEYSDIWDIEVVSIARNVWDYDQKFNEITSKFHDIILEKEKILVIKGYNSIHLPYKVYRDINYNYPRIIKANKTIPLDMTDVLLLSMLSKNCRCPLYELAGKVNLTCEAVSHRLKKLYNANIIRKYASLINLSSLGYHMFSFMMQAKTFNLEYDSRLRSFVLSHPYIIRAVKTLGSWDFLFYIVAESPRQFHETVKEIKSVFSEIIRSHDTLLGYKEHYFNPFPDYIIKEFSQGNLEKPHSIYYIDKVAKDNEE